MIPAAPAVAPFGLSGLSRHLFLFGACYKRRSSNCRIHDDQTNGIKMQKTPARLLALVAAFLIAASASARAADLDIKAFFGTFQGGGVANDADSLYFGVTARDFDVQIAPAGNGFEVKWTSVIRSGGTPSKPDVRRKTSALTFAPTNRPGVWRASDSGDPVGGNNAAWARIGGNKLSVYLMVVLDDGRYELQQHDRTLTGQGMELVFTRLRDGDQVRTVKGRLVKVAK